MASGRLLRQLVKTGAEGNRDAFLQATEEVIRDERSKNHHLLANDLERILYGRAESPGRPRFSPTAYPRTRNAGSRCCRSASPCACSTMSYCRTRTARSWMSCSRSIIVASCCAATVCTPRTACLFCGPPGCGKTITAEIVAGELALPLAIVRIDSVMSSYLGETAANLRQVFDFITTYPLVVLFDEFDALAKERSDASDHGELKRVVNAFLQMLDGYRGKSLLIAATNHERILDTAIWRRFDEVLVFDPPNQEQIKRLLAIKLRGVRRQFETNDGDIIGLFKGMSHADVERVLRRAVKDMVLTGVEFLTRRNVEAAIRREDARRARTKRG